MQNIKTSYRLEIISLSLEGQNFQPEKIENLSAPLACKIFVSKKSQVIKAADIYVLNQENYLFDEQFDFLFNFLEQNFAFLQSVGLENVSLCHSSFYKTQGNLALNVRQLKKMVELNVNYEGSFYDINAKARSILENFILLPKNQEVIKNLDKNFFASFQTILPDFAQNLEIALQTETNIAAQIENQIYGISAATLFAWFKQNYREENLYFPKEFSDFKDLYEQISLQIIES